MFFFIFFFFYIGFLLFSSYSGTFPPVAIFPQTLGEFSAFGPRERRRTRPSVFTASGKRTRRRVPRAERYSRPEKNPPRPLLSRAIVRAAFTPRLPSNPYRKIPFPVGRDHSFETRNEPLESEQYRASKRTVSSNLSTDRSFLTLDKIHVSWFVVRSSRRTVKGLISSPLVSVGR